jgi:hypothetical protein
MENRSKNKMAIELENVFSIFRGPNGTIFAIIFAIVIVLLTIGMYSISATDIITDIPSVKFVQK